MVKRPKELRAFLMRRPRQILFSFPIKAIDSKTIGRQLDGTLDRHRNQDRNVANLKKYRHFVIINTNTYINYSLDNPLVVTIIT